MTITLRADKGAPLTHQELDQNFVDLDRLRGVMSRAEFETLAAANRDKCAGSGFVEWGFAVELGSLHNKVNEGIWVSPGELERMKFGSESASATGTSKGKYPTLNVNGHRITFKQVGTSALASYVNFPPAPTVSTLPERQDLVFIEVWHEKINDKDFVYPFGNIQYGAAADPATGLAAINGSFAGYDTYSLLGNWQASLALVGNGLVWSTMSLANQQKFVSDPENNCYLSEAGDLIQVRYRVRVVEGMGADWQTLDTQGSGAFGYSVGNYLEAKGKKTSIASEWSVGGDFVASGNTTWRLSPEPGQFSAHDPTNIFSEAGIIAIPIALVSRRNQGAFHPVWNPGGGKEFYLTSPSSNSPWYSTNETVASTLDCFDAAKVNPYTGELQYTTPVGPHFKYHDVIYEGDVLDLRISAQKQDVSRCLEREFNKLIAGETRGWEKGRRITIAEPSNVITSSGFFNGATFIYSTTRFVDHNIGSQEERTTTIGAIWSDVDAKYYLVKAVFIGTTYDGCYLLDSYGSIPAKFTAGQPFRFVAFEDILIENKTQLVCDIVGDLVDYPAVWKSDGVMGNPLIVGEEGEDYIPDNSSKTIKLHRKAKATPVLVLKTADSGVTWTDETSAFSAVWTAASNSYTKVLGTGSVFMIFYEAEASPFELAVNAEVLALADTYATQQGDRRYGGALNDLIGKIGIYALGGDGTQRLGRSFGHELSELQALMVGAGAKPTHRANTLGAYNPAIKVLPYLARENGRLFLQMLYKEMIYDLTWGDDSQFPVVSNESTEIDDNGNVTKVGQQRLELPYFIGNGD